VSLNIRVKSEGMVIMSRQRVMRRLIASECYLIISERKLMKFLEKGVVVMEVGRT
jgi:hypothetical protein